MRSIAILLLLLGPVMTAGQDGSYAISTVDIDRFWAAYDRLPAAKTKQDSIDILQRHYIDQASDGFKQFIAARNFTAEEYVRLIKAYPKFWPSIRPLTERIAQKAPEVRRVFEAFQFQIPGFKPPDVCFAIGGLRTGGTTRKGMILIGAEIAAADSTVERSELTPWLKAVLGQHGDITALVAHEAIHTRQTKRFRRNLLSQTLQEGIADFLPYHLLGIRFNGHIFEYGQAHECEIWRNFRLSMEQKPDDWSEWLYNGSQAKDRPADLGYYVGYKIAEAYWLQTENKAKAYKHLLNGRKYKAVFKKSAYGSQCSNVKG